MTLKKEGSCQKKEKKAIILIETKFSQISSMTAGVVQVDQFESNHLVRIFFKIKVFCGRDGEHNARIMCTYLFVIIALFIYFLLVPVCVGWECNRRTMVVAEIVLA